MGLPRNGNAVWVTRLNMGVPHQVIRPIDNLVRISFFQGNGQNGYGFEISRGDARLLAKRINQCLDGTLK